MKNKKGFTLVELLITIAIMVSILVISIVSYSVISKRKKHEAYNAAKEQILDAANSYFYTNEYLFEGVTEGANGLITLKTLVKEDYIGIVTDPRTGKAFSMCTEITVTKKGNNFDLSLKEDSINFENKDCEGTDNSVIITEPGGPKITAKFEGIDINKDDDWYNGDVKVIVTADENKNGPIKEIQRSTDSVNFVTWITSDKGTDSDSYKNDTAGKTATYKAINQAGKSAIAIVSAKVDSIPPKCSYEVNKQASSTGWYNNKTGAPVLSFKGTDELSGISGDSSYKPAIKTGSNNYSYTFKDKAGNVSNTCSISLKYDNTNPFCSVSLSGDRKNTSQSYWYTSNVTLKGTCSDKDTGCVQGTISNTISAEGRYSNASAGTVSDKAGNTNTCTYGTNFGIDKTTPVFDNRGGGYVHCKDVKSKNYLTWGYSISYHDALSGATAYMPWYYSSWNCSKFGWASSSLKQYNKDPKAKTFTVFAGCGTDNPSPAAKFKLVDGAGNATPETEIKADMTIISSSNTKTCNENTWFTQNR